MAEREVIYVSLDDAKFAKRRDQPRHLNGWRPLHTDSLSNGKTMIVWNNDPDLPPPPKRQLTQRQLLDEIAEERNVRLA